MHTGDLRTFAEGQIFGMTLAATAQRSNLYAKGLSETERRPFQKSLRVALEGTAQAYRSGISEDEHVRNISALASGLSSRHASLLRDGRMRFGHAQKALNLYLKYLWCFAFVPMPPHCPLDSIILKRIPGFTGERWTHLDNPTRYLQIILAAKKVANGLPLAVWELHEYNASDT